MALSAEILSRKAAFESEQRRKRILAYTSYSLVVTVFSVIMMMLSGSAFSGFLGLLGLKAWVNPEIGVYADCSKPENARVSYCRPAIPEAESDWRVLKKRARKLTPFSLHAD